MKKLLVLALVLMSANVFAQPASGPDGLGIYFDTAALTNSKTYHPEAQANCYLVATNISQVGIGSWEAHIYTSPNVIADDLIFNFNVPTSVVNALTAPDFLCGVAPAYVTAPAMWLLRIRFDTPMDGAPVYIGHGPALEVTNFPGEHVASYGNGASTILTRFVPSSNALPIPGVPGGYYTACTNAPGPVAASNDSWSGVKSLYR